MRRSRGIVGLVATATLLVQAQASIAQLVPNNWIGAAGDWNSGGNWSVGLVPAAFADEIATIDNGGTARISGSVDDVAGIDVSSGAVEIQSGGSVNVVEGLFTAGNRTISVGGSGTLSIASGGSLSGGSLNSSGTLVVTGPTAAIALDENLSLRAGSTFTAEIGTGGFQPISVGGNAALRGAIDVQLGGASPAVGDSWDLVDAGSLDARPETISISGGGILGLGQAFRVRQREGGANGFLAQLALEQRLVLGVDRDSGVVSIRNPGAADIQIDGYGVQSAIGSMDPAAFSSLESQGRDGNSWLEIGILTAQGIAELNRDGAGTIGSGQSVDIGSIYDPNFVAFGVDTEDYVFSYTTPDGDILEGPVDYSGNKKFNNLVLKVDPDTGVGVMENESPFAIDIDGYAIQSESGQLTPATWSSLEDQGAAGGDWNEFNSSATQLGELKLAGATTLSENARLNLGQIFNLGTGGGASPGDLVFEFLLAGEFEASSGVVVFESVGALPTADFDNDGDIDGEDYAIWQAGFGTAQGATSAEGDADGDGDIDGVDFLKWQAGHGTGAGQGGANAAAVPEPATVSLLVLLGTLATLGPRRPRR